MSDSSKVIWKEGMFITPQHFQQQERYLSWYIDNTFDVGAEFGAKAGFASLEINHDLLKIGKFAVANSSGFLPGGGYFAHDEEVVIDIPPDVVEKIVFLTLPVVRKGVPEYVEQGGLLTRYVGKDMTVFDTSSDDNSSVDVLVGNPNIGLMLEGQDLSGFLALPVARVLQTSTDGEVILDGSFLPMSAVFGASAQLVERVREIETLVISRAQVQLSKITAEVNPNTQYALFREYMLLQNLYRWRPWLATVLHECKLSTRTLYLKLCQFDAELASISAEPFPSFEILDPKDAYSEFNRVLSSLRERLTLVQQDSVVEFEVNNELFSENRLMRIAIPDPTAVSKHRFFLSVNAGATRSESRSYSNWRVDELQELFQRTSKLAGSRVISELIRRSLSGITLIPLPVAPGELKPELNTFYFRIDADNDFWREIMETRDIVTLHVDTRIPNPHVRFFAIR